MVTVSNIVFRIFSFFISILQLLNIDITAKEITVELYTNPSSGYNWEYTMDEIGYLMLVATNYEDDSGSAIAGVGGGTKSFTFRSIRSGTVNVTFSYTKLDGFNKIVATEYIYTFDIAEDGTVTIVNIQ